MGVENCRDFKKFVLYKFRFESTEMMIEKLGK